MKDTVKRWTGLPVGVGIGKTKTLAKLANNAAKKADGVVVLNSDGHDQGHPRHDAGKGLWGIGRQYDKLLEAHGIRTAYEFANARDSWIRKHMHITGLRTAQELRGVPCIPLEEQPDPKKNITVSRMFGRPITALQGLEEAITTYATRAAEKLRREGCRPTPCWCSSIPVPSRTALRVPTAPSPCRARPNYTPDLIAMR